MAERSSRGSSRTKQEKGALRTGWPSGEAPSTAMPHMARCRFEPQDTESIHIFVAGLSQETNNFIETPTTLDDFTIEDDRGPGAPSTLALTSLWEERAIAEGHRCTVGPSAWAPPGGRSPYDVYCTLRDRILAALAAAPPVDVVLLMLHGAMLAEGIDDCEADLLAHVRASVGEAAAIGVELDLHCHLSEAKIAPADIVITYKEYPHTDANARAGEVFDLTLATRRGDVRPVMALASCGMLGLYPTNRAPLRGLVDAMGAAEAAQGLLSLSMGHGFPFGDVVHGGAKILAVADGDPALAAEIARTFANRAHAMRAEIGFETLSLPLDEALGRAFALPGLVVVGDQSDNPGGGAPGDATHALNWVLETGAGPALFAIFHDPQAIAVARAAGAGRSARFPLGGKRGALQGEPVARDWQVMALRDRVEHVFAQAEGPPMRFPLGDAVWLRSGTIDVIVSERPCQCYGPDIFEAFGIPLGDEGVVIVKSAQHFTSGFAGVADHLLYMAGPGVVAPDPRHIPYRKFDTTGFYPWNADRTATGDVRGTGRTA